MRVPAAILAREERVRQNLTSAIERISISVITPGDNAQNYAARNKITDRRRNYRSVLSAICIPRTPPTKLRARALVCGIMSRNFRAELRHVTCVVNVVYMESRYAVKIICTSLVATVVMRLLSGGISKPFSVKLIIETRVLLYAVFRYYRRLVNLPVSNRHLNFRSFHVGI